jgi:hypothetical protein
VLKSRLSLYGRVPFSIDDASQIPSVRALVLVFRRINLQKLSHGFNLQRSISLLILNQLSLFNLSLVLNVLIVAVMRIEALYVQFQNNLGKSVFIRHFGLDLAFIV